MFCVSLAVPYRRGLLTGFRGSVRSPVTGRASGTQLGCDSTRTMIHSDRARTLDRRSARSVPRVEPRKPVSSSCGFRESICPARDFAAEAAGGRSQHPAIPSPPSWPPDNQDDWSSRKSTTARCCGALAAESPPRPRRGACGGTDAPRSCRCCQPPPRCPGRLRPEHLVAAKQDFEFALLQLNALQQLDQVVVGVFQPDQIGDATCRLQQFHHRQPHARHRRNVVEIKRQIGRAGGIGARKSIRSSAVRGLK